MRPEHADKLKARFTRLPLTELGGVLLRSAGILLEMPDNDNRHMFAQEYLGKMLERLDRREIQAGELSKIDPSFIDSATLGEFYFPASAEMQGQYGSSTPLPTLANFTEGFDPVVAMWAQQGMDAVDAVLTQQIIGDPKI